MDDAATQQTPFDAPGTSPRTDQAAQDRLEGDGATGVQHMKWWGWGREGVSFDHRDKPKLRPFVIDRVGIDLDTPGRAALDFDQLPVPDSRAPQELLDALAAAAGADHVQTGAMERVVHTYGKSLRDLLRLRAGDLPRTPDVVVYPGDEDAVRAVVDAVAGAGAVLIPFGGGSSISGSLHPDAGEERPVVSLDLGRMNRVLEVDEHSRLARVQAGVLGPDLEDQLGARGWTMGHVPDSFTHSTLGGWIATRSSGAQSDKYGDIADLTRALRVVQPGRVVATRHVPSEATGPSVRDMLIGSEGRLGVITEAWVQVHRLPEQRQILGYFFPSFEAGIAAMRDISASDASTVLTRVSDPNETAFSFATGKRSRGVSHLVSSGLKTVLKRRGWDLDSICLSFVGYEGAPSFVKANQGIVKGIVKAHGGIVVGKGPGTLYDQKKFDTPYIRDYILDRGALADVSDTAAPWSGLLPLYRHVREEADRAFARVGVKGWIMCHLSHSYHGGACLYFTFAFAQTSETPLVEYDVVKGAIQQAFVDSEGTLSHHHSVGTEHAQWLAQDISPAGRAMLGELFAAVDPQRQLNPGAIVD
ncbi:FAD-binding oxidoreductase [uncultured Pseudokineococcus sp.]|uniref:FAD-binding oxidoreductase n=1 Tax=uncultured Pseudokineococcus sp. TaxID=1642928 RepID=UPI002639251C|nr:FAD-binding oxidoreductase [uncultured Pseudokineococcus sp.]